MVRWPNCASSFSLNRALEAASRVGFSGRSTSSFQSCGSGAWAMALTLSRSGMSCQMRLPSFCTTSVGASPVDSPSMGGAVRVGEELGGRLRRRLLGHAHTGTPLLERRGDSWGAAVHGALRLMERRGG